MSVAGNDVSVNQGGPPPDDHLAQLRPLRVVLSEAGHVGEALRNAREGLGLAADDISQVTHVRSSYIEAIEAFDFESLPARPFVVGFVRSYARALGLDPDLVVARFRREAPEVDAKLRAPIGLSPNGLARFRPLLLVAGALASVVTVWNLSRHLPARPARPAAAARPAGGAPLAAAIEVGPPLPPPPEATTPPAYVTPGLDPAANATTAASPPPAAPESNLGETYAIKGAVFGTGSAVVLQARKAVGLVVRGGGGAIIFARVLEPGETWRSADRDGLSADIDSGDAMEYFVGGISKGVLPKGRTALAGLGAGQEAATPNSR